jgi:hypothetical protein
MILRRYLTAVTVALAAMGLAAACNHVTGPALSAEILSQQLVPTSGFANAAQLCCCHVQGTIRNTSSITVHVSFRWKAFDRNGAEAGTAFDYVKNIAPGATATYDGAGIAQPCSAIARVEPDVLVIGLFDAHR